MLEKRQRPIQEINQNGKVKPGLDYTGVTPLSSRDLSLSHAMRMLHDNYAQNPPPGL